FPSEPGEIMALGRPFDLGMFYDCRSDKLIPGITLWDKEKLDRDMRVTSKPNTEFKIVASESISDKSSSLDVEASLKASFLCGLVSVEGAAKYLNDNKKSSKQARVTLQYKTTTVFKQLTMDQLGTGNLTHCEVINKGLATHVVTAILYGAQAFFVFDQETSEDENVQDIQGSLKMMIEKIPTIPFSARGALKIEEKDREKVNKFSCTFHGDVILEKSPTTFEEAVKVFQDLPRLLGSGGEKVVPVTVYLLPLTTLDSKASKLVRQISLRLVTEAQNILEGFIELETWCNDVLKSPAGQNFPQLYKKIKKFKGLCSEFMVGLKRTLSQKLPLIRGGGEKEAVLAEVLKKASEGPFSSHRLKQWMEDKDKEFNTIKTLINLMKNTEVVSSENALTDKVTQTEKALVFVFTSLDSPEPFLSDLERYLKGSMSTISNGPVPIRWYSSQEVANSVRRKAKLFSDFQESNDDRKSFRFLVVGLADRNHEGSVIYLYEDGFRVSQDFEVPTSPTAVVSSRKDRKGFHLHGTLQRHSENLHNTLQRQSDKARNKIGLKAPPCAPPENLTGTASSTVIRVRWKGPKLGKGVNINGYIVEYGQTQKKIQWKTEQSQSEEILIPGLQPETTYSIRVLCDCGEQGISRESSSIIVTTKDKESHEAGTDIR
uniref:Fibronectin type-III domain-containing protein n=1 Tax=Neogobius melanostomus TaxID=47308 RepID=A0A8C6U4Q1_9GOBI